MVVHEQRCGAVSGERGHQRVRQLQLQRSDDDGGADGTADRDVSDVSVRYGSGAAGGGPEWQSQWAEPVHDRYAEHAAGGAGWNLVEIAGDESDGGVRELHDA